MGGGSTLAVLSLACVLQADDRLQSTLARLAEEAEAFRMIAPQVLGEETLVQRARKAPPRFRPRIGSAAAKRPEPQFQTREIISEYGFSTFDESPDALHEFREVISVDGREVVNRDQARQTLAMGMKSRDDRLKRRMLKNFEKHGLKGAAADFGQLILLFEKRRLGDYQFQLAGKGRIGADEALAFTFVQSGGEDGVTIFEGRQVIRRPLRGEVWVRESDFLPLRIRLAILRDHEKHVILDEAEVDYQLSAHGALLPASVVHRELVAGQLLVENVFRYSSFRRFTAEAEIKFTEVPPEPPNEK